MVETTRKHRKGDEVKRENPFLKDDNYSFGFGQGCSFEKVDPEIEKLKEAVNNVSYRSLTAINRATEALIEINELKGQLLELTNWVTKLADLIVKKGRDDS